MQQLLTAGPASAAIEEALAGLPGDVEARSEFFTQWRQRTIQALELSFVDDPRPAQRFKEIEFGPRRLSGDEARDEQARREAYAAGCEQARALLHELLRKESGANESASLLPAADRECQPPADRAEGSLPLRQSLAALLQAWEHRHIEQGTEICGKVLMELVELARDRRFSATYEDLLRNAAAAGLPASDSPELGAPLLVWAVLQSINEALGREPVA